MQSARNQKNFSSGSQAETSAQHYVSNRRNVSWQCVANPHTTASSIRLAGRILNIKTRPQTVMYNLKYYSLF